MMNLTLFTRDEDTETLISAARERFGVLLTPEYARSLLTFIADTYRLADERAEDEATARRLLERLAMMAESRARLISLKSVVRSAAERDYLRKFLK